MTHRRATQQDDGDKTIPLIVVATLGMIATSAVGCHVGYNTGVHNGYWERYDKGWTHSKELHTP